MASPMRLNPELIRAAEAESLLHKRSVPRQIEFWAELGRQLADVLSMEDLLAVRQGLARLELKPVQGAPLDTDEVFAEVSELRDSGGLYEAVTEADFHYEPSRHKAGMLDRVFRDGRRETGSFQDGEFRLADSA